VRPLATVLIFAASGCSWFPTEGGLHREGERTVSARAAWGSPIVGKALAWNGLGDVPNYGMGVQSHWFQNDRLAIGAGMNLINFKPKGENVTGGELEARARYFFAESEDVGLFWDFMGGFMRTESQIPPGGTRGNFTFAFGPGIEMPLGDGDSVLLGVEFHHMSNALGRDSSRNPSQNEFLFWLSYTKTW
jgi:Lipid A 3-O-deacylase (PagL)